MAKGSLYSILLLLVLLGPAACADMGKPHDQDLIPRERRIVWNPGIPGGIPDVAVAANVRDFGAVGDGITDDTNAFEDAIASVETPGAVLIPTGTYRITRQLLIQKEVVLRGEGASLTHLYFDLGGRSTPALTIGAPVNDAPFVRLTEGYSRGSTKLIFAENSTLQPGDYAELVQDNDATVMINPAWDQPWAQNTVGQIFQIVAVDGNVVMINDPLSLDYTTSLHPRVRKLNVIQHAGIERLHLKRLDNADAHLTKLTACVYCWMDNIESEYASRAHAVVIRGYHDVIRDSYFHHAHDYGGGGHGYGVSLEERTSGTLVENNIFYHLRHAMLVKTGATGNVFGYNYSTDPIWPDNAGSPPDISLHGHFPSYNLFEGNIASGIAVSDYWGPSGPGNTFFRNQLTRAKSDQRGIWINDSSHLQNIVGNNVLYGAIYISPSAKNILLDGNRVRGSVSWNKQTDNRQLPTSYYLTGKPSFYGDLPWPSVGADVPSGINPASLRFKSTNP